MRSRLFLLIPVLLFCACQQESLLNTYTIRGFIGRTNEPQSLFQGFKVVLKSGDEIISTTTANPFEFPNLQEGLEYTVIPEYDLNKDAGISGLDFVILRKILKGEIRANAFLRLASDTNENGTLERTDPDELMLCMLTKQCPGWRFATPDYDGFGKGSVDQHVIPFLDSDRDIQFIPVKIGDVNGTIGIH